MEKGIKNNAFTQKFLRGKVIPYSSLKSQSHKNRCALLVLLVNNLYLEVEKMKRKNNENSILIHVYSAVGFLLVLKYGIHVPT